MKRKNAFTLIELLAIIVILAIIAVITVPIILNIIENAKKGAAQDSAYGYKDAINKWYVQELTGDSTKRLNGTYTISNGKLNNIDIPLSGDKPTNGTLTYSNNILTGGCLTIGDYKVTFDSKGNPSSTEKGECDVTPTIASCPGCKFIYPEEQLYLGTSIIPEEATNNYTTLTNTYSYFFGVIPNQNTGEIERAFACGIEGTTPFCIEGATDGSTKEDNKELLTSIFGEYDDETHLGCYQLEFGDRNFICEGTTVKAVVTSNSVSVGSGGPYCDIDNGLLTCNESGK